jgi:acetyltransferase-like isoleucine patch superfamily enzyme
MYTFILSTIKNIMIYRFKLRALFWSFFMKEVGKNVQIASDVFITGPKFITLKENVMIGAHSEIIPSADVVIGSNTQLGGHLYLVAGGNITIGKNVLLGPGCKIVAFSHNYQEADRSIMSQGTSCKGITIEEDVWIGANVVVLDGVTISRGAVVGAGAVVTKNVSPYSVVGGVPAKEIKKRNAD